MRQPRRGERHVGSGYRGRRGTVGSAAYLRVDSSFSGAEATYGEAVVAVVATALGAVAAAAASVAEPARRASKLDRGGSGWARLERGDSAMEELENIFVETGTARRHPPVPVPAFPNPPAAATHRGGPRCAFPVFPGLLIQIRSLCDRISGRCAGTVARTSILGETRHV
ncbi:unnamed protein product [Lampetra fluviatilis]